MIYMGQKLVFPLMMIPTNDFLNAGVDIQVNTKARESSRPYLFVHRLANFRRKLKTVASWIIFFRVSVAMIIDTSADGVRADWWRHDVHCPYRNRLGKNYGMYLVPYNLDGGY